MTIPPAPAPTLAPGPQTADHLLNGAVRLAQAARGYRAGLDAALLAAACDAKAGQRVLDVGCGAGGALLAAAYRRPLAQFTGVERDEDALSLARANIIDNGMRHVSVVAGDVGAGFAALGLAAFDSVICNPPFFDDPDALRGPAAEKQDAWMAQDGLPVWIAFLTKAAREGGAVTLIHRADRLGDILLGFGSKIGSVQVMPIHPFADAPAKRVLVRGVKTGRAPMLLLPPLVLHERGGPKHMPRVEAILRGEAAIDWR